ncbi:polysaccharide deacetylase family protein [Mycobacterium sp. NBC_00419]|uniref:polysaccharide deacetylase family protein n=1 Tax=Mycobacterium sp. NBC_00419 TaxID=2975989 RepID=UPI002E222A7A
MTRRQFVVGLLASAALVGASRTIGISGSSSQAAAQAPPPPPPIGSSRVLPPPSIANRVPLPGGGELAKLPGDGDLLALTVDDGVNSEVVRAYTQLAKDTGIRLTFFVNGVYDSWRDNAEMLRPLVDSGQIQLGNHTWSHPDLTTLNANDITDQLRRNDRFLRNTYGADATPYFRPPYGNHNDLVDGIAADQGYRVPTMWSGSLADSVPVTEDYIVTMADQYFIQQNIVIGHLNHLPVTHVYPALVDIIRSRNLRTVTLNDVFLKPEIPYVTSS